MNETSSGRTWLFGDNISTDHILPSRFMTQIKPQELAANCLVGADPEFARQVKPGDIVVAGVNIGYGSSREQAPQALKYAGVGAVIAKSFARIFYRNCYNVGIPAIVCPEFVVAVQSGDQATINLAGGTITNLTNGVQYLFLKPPAFLIEYIRLGGLIPYLAAKLTCGKDGNKEE
ncbi:MAG: 3-isopropylmalate dehydratase small subunit [Veillonellaceae bacterium]|nr:3-isopropylmalate dehydratase small subunit [Veillonellaceae bacterium]